MVHSLLLIQLQSERSFKKQSSEVYLGVILSTQNYLALNLLSLKINVPVFPITGAPHLMSVTFVCTKSMGYLLTNTIITTRLFRNHTAPNALVALLSWSSFPL